MLVQEIRRVSEVPGPPLFPVPAPGCALDGLTEATSNAAGDCANAPLQSSAEIVNMTGRTTVKI
jgi:hypothetical protein